MRLMSLISPCTIATLKVLNIHGQMQIENKNNGILSLVGLQFCYIGLQSRLSSGKAYGVLLRRFML